MGRGKLAAAACTGAVDRDDSVHQHQPRTTSGLAFFRLSHAIESGQNEPEAALAP